MTKNNENVPKKKLERVKKLANAETRTRIKIYTAQETDEQRNRIHNETDTKEDDQIHRTDNERKTSMLRMCVCAVVAVCCYFYTKIME